MIEEVKVCACGLEMVPPVIGAVAVRCNNCDSVQPIEHKSGRIKTVWDRRFALEWERRKRLFYEAAA